MPSFGEKLKQEREKRKITLEEISLSTKIGTRMLQALEEDKFNQLPGGIFNKGFVRAYSRVVGLDEEQTVAEYLQASGDAPPARTELGGLEAAGHTDRARENNNNNNNNEANVARMDANADTPARPLPWGLFAAALLVVALALSLWSHHQRDRTRPSVPPTPTTAAAPLPGVSSEGNVASSPIPGSSKNGPSTTGSLKAKSIPSASPAAVKATTSPATSAPTATPGEFTIVIRAREDCWISITADGKTTASELLAAGTERTVRGRKEVIVKAGNAGGLDFRFNGNKLDAGGEYGEVKTVTFGPGGIIPNAPAPPSTP